MCRWVSLSSIICDVGECLLQRELLHARSVRASSPGSRRAGSCLTLTTGSSRWLGVTSFDRLTQGIDELERELQRA